MVDLWGSLAARCRRDSLIRRKRRAKPGQCSSSMQHEPPRTYGQRYITSTNGLSRRFALPFSSCPARDACVASWAEARAWVRAWAAARSDCLNDDATLLAGLDAIEDAGAAFHAQFVKATPIPYATTALWGSLGVRCRATVGAAPRSTPLACRGISRHLAFSRGTTTKRLSRRR